MSLVYFHIFLITVAVIFAAGFGFWELARFGNTDSQTDLWVSVVSFVFALGSAVYLAWFIKKKKPSMKDRQSL